ITCIILPLCRHHLHLHHLLRSIHLCFHFLGHFPRRLRPNFLRRYSHHHFPHYPDCSLHPHHLFRLHLVLYLPNNRCIHLRHIHHHIHRSNMYRHHLQDNHLTNHHHNRLHRNHPNNRHPSNHRVHHNSHSSYHLRNTRLHQNSLLHLPIDHQSNSHHLSHKTDPIFRLLTSD